MKTGKNTIAKYIGKNIKIKRIIDDLGQCELAEKAGISQGYLSLIENGRQQPTLKTLEEIANILKIPVSELVKDIKN